MPEPDWMHWARLEQHTREQREQNQREMLRPVGSPGQGPGGRWISFPGGIVGVALACLVIVVVFGGRQLFSDNSAPTPAGTLAVVAPATLQGRPLNTDSQFDHGNNLTETRLSGIGGTTSVFSRVYGTSNDDLIIVGAAVGTYTDFSRTVDYVVDAVEGHGLGAYHSVDPGRFGGSAKCGGYIASGMNLGVCVWVDRGTVGEIVFYNSDAAQAGKALAATRGELEQTVG
ncbi:hypothetical protein [Paractinoplanes atraurantiacus]|uniref:Uncharacterized protein n=1 Tax=Paractinoplanes atraurantiacus TaxID=1036182 RepID=A0A285JXF6_9ACTN|nr:hypothetical protein [Actinoplanes atraurantiacus]SNY65004.1 hypothetical protein SAMN05421748_127109 [Actinoplanes atraurantiacus]